MERDDFVLQPEHLRRVDESPDHLFYQVPRLVRHIDEAAVGRVVELYRREFPAGGAILDLASSWISHLPEEVAYREVTGLGLNRHELETNPRLSRILVQDLNEYPELPFPENYFDGVAVCVSIDYLIHPVEVVREAGRVLKPGAPLVVTFSNRAFWTKTVAIWNQLSEAGRSQLVCWYLRKAGNFEDIQPSNWIPDSGDPLYAVVGKAA